MCIYGWGQVVNIAEKTPQLIENEHISLMIEMDRQRIATMAQLTNERLAVLEMIQEERIAVIDALREERIATMKAFGNMTAKAIEESTSQMKALMDHFFLRLIQILAILVLLGFIALFFRKRSHTKNSTAD